jgi:hypothetical protein
MKTKTMMSGLLAIALSSLTASACLVQVRIACPNDRAASGVTVCIAGSITGCAVTDNLGIVSLLVPQVGNYTVCVDPSTLPAGATLTPLCKNIKVQTEDTTYVDISLGGNFCSTPPVPGPCWLTGGGTIGKGKTPDFSFGGVVYPGCSPKAADGGNWNVVSHNDGLHFSGQAIVVDGCSGVPTSSPKVTVNVIDFHGTGIVSGIGGNPDATIAVTFIGRAVDNHDGGAGADQLYLQVRDGSNNVVLQIGTSAAAPATISTGNLQIHQTSCNN